MSVCGLSVVFISQYNLINHPLKIFPLSALSLKVFEALVSPLFSGVYKIVCNDVKSPSTANIEISGGPLYCWVFFISSNCEDLQKRFKRIRRMIAVSLRATLKAEDHKLVEKFSYCLICHLVTSPLFSLTSASCLPLSFKQKMTCYSAWFVHPLDERRFPFIMSI